MKISDLIEKLEEVLEAEGDLDVGIVFTSNGLVGGFTDEIEIDQANVCTPHKGAVRFVVLKKIPKEKISWVH